MDSQEKSPKYFQVAIDIFKGEKPHTVRGFLRSGSASMDRILGWQNGYNDLTLRASPVHKETARIRIPAEFGKVSIVWYDEDMNNDK